MLVALPVLVLLWNLSLAQDVTTVEATSTDISDNLDLKAVASLFGEAEDLEDFERRLNDPESQISNLDLNGDNEVDYLRVVEVSKDGTFVITIQSVLGPDQYQDVATVDVEKDENGQTKVQVVGDVYMYGPDYIIEPYYARPPVIYVYLYSPRYDPWYSPYYYGYYPVYYRPWHPYPTYYYVEHVHIHRSVTTTYVYAPRRYSSRAVVLQTTHSHHYYVKSNPGKSFSQRNEGLTNKKDIIEKREANSGTKQQSKPATKQVQENWKPASGATDSGTKVSVPNTKATSADPTTKPRLDLSKDPTLKQPTSPVAKPTDSPARTPVDQDRKPASDPYARPNPNPRANQQVPERGTKESPQIQQRQSEQPTRLPATRPNQDGQIQNTTPAAKPVEGTPNSRTVPSNQPPSKPSGQGATQKRSKKIAPEKSRTNSGKPKG